MVGTAMEAAQKSLQSCEQQIVSVLKLASELVSLLHASPGTADEDERMDEFESRFTTYMNTLDVSLHTHLPLTFPVDTGAFARYCAASVNHRNPAGKGRAVPGQRICRGKGARDSEGWAGPCGRQG